MKIRLLLDSHSLGGVETHVMNLCEELTNRERDCKIVFVCHYPNNILYSLCEQRSISYLSCNSFKELYDLLGQNKADIIHAHGYKANLFARIIGLAHKIPVVTTFHTGEKPNFCLLSQQ